MPSHSLIGWFSYSDGKESVYKEDNGCFFDSGGKLDCRQQFCLAAKMIERLPLAQEEKYALAVKYQLWWSKVYQPQKEEKRRLQDG